MSGRPTQLDRDRLEKLISAFPQVHLLVLGDVVLDEYLYGEVERMSPEAPVPALSMLLVYISIYFDIQYVVIGLLYFLRRDLWFPT